MTSASRKSPVSSLTYNLPANCTSFVAVDSQVRQRIEETAIADGNGRQAGNRDHHPAVCISASRPRRPAACLPPLPVNSKKRSKLDEKQKAGCQTGFLWENLKLKEVKPTGVCRLSCTRLKSCRLCILGFHAHIIRY